MVNRICNPLKSNSFFLFGPRGVGKSFLLKTLFQQDTSYFIDLLRPKIRLEYLRDPERLIKVCEQLGPDKEWIIIDEIQKVPNLLDVVHELIEMKKWKFVLTGSSARKLKRSAGNLLGGRAFVYHLHPFCYFEIKDRFEITQALNWGTLPKIFELEKSEEKIKYLKSYVATFVKEEIQEEQIVRKIEPFISFLEVSSQSDCKIINFSNIAKDVGVDTKTVQSYFQILEDTLLGFKLNPYHESIRKRQNRNPKFYYFDPGVSRALSRSITIPLAPGSFEFGNRFEQFFILQCLAMNNYLDCDFKFSYLRTKDDFEVDLIIERPGKSALFIEIKSSEKINTSEFIGLRNLASEYPRSQFIVASQDKLEFSENGIEYRYWIHILNDIFYALKPN